MPESESDKLKRLRSRQLTDRDPLTNERKFQRNMSVKEKRMQKPISLISLAEDWRNVPYIVKSPLYALIIGVIGAIVLVKLWDWQYAIYVGIGVAILLVIFSAVIGNALDLREDIKKHLR